MTFAHALGRLRRWLLPPLEVHPGFQEFRRLHDYALANKPELWNMISGMPFAPALRTLGGYYGIEIPENAPLSTSCRLIRLAMAE